MKAILTRVDYLQKSGMSKNNQPYTLDFTNLAISMPIDNDSSFGHKEEVYPYGDYNAHKEFLALKNKLPVPVEFTLSNRFNDFGKSETYISDIKVFNESLPTADSKK